MLHWAELEHSAQPDAVCDAVHGTLGPGVGGHGAGGGVGLGEGPGPGAGPPHAQASAGQFGGCAWQFALHQASLTVGLMAWQ